MTTAAEQYRALVNRLESIQEAPVDPRSPGERDSQMAAVKSAYADYQDAEDKKYSDAMKTYGQQVTAQSAPTSPVSSDVKKIQTLLNAKGANLTVDGKLGANTLAAIVKHLEAAQPQQAAQPAVDKRQPFTVGNPVPGSDAASSVAGDISKSMMPFAKSLIGR